jgi:WD40 repeat protein
MSVDLMLLATSTSPHQQKSWIQNVQTGKANEVTFPEADPLPVVCSPDEKALGLIAGGVAKICDPQTGKLLQTLSLAPRPNLRLSVLAWSPDSKGLAFGTSENHLGVWDVESGNIRMHRESEHRAPPVTLTWLTTKSLVSASRSEVCFWDTESEKLVRKIAGGGDVLSPDARIIATRGQSSVRLRSLESDQTEQTLLSLRDQQYAVISPDGHWRGSAKAASEFIYVVQTDQGQETLTPEEFSKRYGWKNDPEKVAPSMPK